MDPFLWNILKFTKKLKLFNEHLMKEKNILIQKTTCPHLFLKCFKHIKGLLKYGEFSRKVFCYNFESIRTYLENIYIYSVPTVIFQIFKKYFLKTVHTWLGSFFLLSSIWFGL